jgi:cell division protein FtsW (lipid II flippase)
MIKLPAEKSPLQSLSKTKDNFVTGPIFFIKAPSPKLQQKFLFFSGIFLFIYSLILTISPFVRSHGIETDLRLGHWFGFLSWCLLVIIFTQLTTKQGLRIDPYISSVALTLSGWGLLTIWRLLPSFGIRQIIWLATSIFTVLIGLLKLKDLSFLRRYKYLWLTTGLIITSLTLIFGTNPMGNGPRLWLGIGNIYLQPTEFLKIFLIIFLAAYLTDRQPFYQNMLQLLIPTMILTSIALLLMLAQRDLGTVSIFILIYTTVIATATRRKRVLIFNILTLGAVSILGYFLFDVVSLRVQSWINPWQDPSGRSYQIVQSLLAIAAGGVMGRGPGLGNPGLVPVPHSDFIFTSIVEEGGLASGLAVILLFTIFVYRGMYLALHAPTNFYRYLAIGFTAYISGQAILIIGGNIRLLPLTGVTLPFVSYGGSSLLSTYIAIFILIHISQHIKIRSDIPQSLTRSIRILTLLLFTGLSTAALITGWWAVYRGPALLTRTDNPRRAISDRYVKRGSLLDRNGELLSTSLGQADELQRVYLYTKSGSTIGYTHSVFGQSGLESSLDPILRGLEYQDPLSLWFHHLVYGQPPPGRDVRLSILLPLQSEADEMMEENSGSVVILNALTGEILAISSTPSFDPNKLDQQWTDLITREDAPLVNRAAQATYQPGTALGPFLLAFTENLPQLPGESNYRLGEFTIHCALPISPNSWVEAVKAGCPGPLAQIGLSLGGDRLLSLFKALGFYTPPQLQMDTISSTLELAISTPAKSAIGQGELRVSPLQMTLAAATLSSGGVRPAPQIAIQVEKTDQYDPVILESLDTPQRVFSQEIAKKIALELASPSLGVWESLGIAYSGPDMPLTWYLTGTLPNRDGKAIVVVVLLEDDNPAEAQSIGQALIKFPIPP